MFPKDWYHIKHTGEILIYLKLEINRNRNKRKVQIWPRHNTWRYGVESVELKPSFITALVFFPMATVTAAVAASLFSPTTLRPTLLRVRSRRGTPQVRSTRISGSVNGVKVVEDGSQISSETQDPPVLYDDGFGKIGVMDYIDRSKEIERFSGDGSPRWFCPLECGRPIKGAPLLLFLPGNG